VIARIAEISSAMDKRREKFERMLEERKKQSEPQEKSGGD
jgi:hypothetical protein